MSSIFNYSYMTMSSSVYLLGFSVIYFFQPIYTDCAYVQKNNHIKISEI